MRGIYLDADWAPAPPDDTDLIWERERLDGALELHDRKHKARKYIRDVRQRAADRARRIFTRALIFFLWAVAFSVLIGTAT